MAGDEDDPSRSANLRIPEHSKEKTAPRTRSMGGVNPTVNQQTEHLASLAHQALRGRKLLDLPSTQQPGRLQLRRKVSALESTWASIQRCHQELLIMPAEADIIAYLESQEYEAARDTYADLLDILDTLQDRLPEVTPAPAVASTSTTSTAGMNSAPAPRLTTLERIPLPTFAGDVKDWAHFYDMFDSLVLKEPSLSNVYRFHYLKQSLQGNALLLIKNIAITNDNFASAWKIVKDHYQDVPMLTFSHLVRLLKLEPLSPGKIGRLENLLIQTREILTSLEALGEPVEQWSSILVALTLLRLDSDLRKDWERHVGKRETYPRYSELESYLQSRVHAEAVANVKSGVTTHQNTAFSSRFEVKKSENKASYSSHVSVTPVVSCPFCNANHYIKACPSFLKLSPDDRLDNVKSRRLCFNCLHRGHFPRDCRSTYSCMKCKKRHHSLLHEALNMESSARLTRDSDHSHEHISDSPTLSISTNMATEAAHELSPTANRSVRVLLATATLRVSTPEGREMTFRALIDQGSERSLISERAAQLLSTKRRSVNATIEGIGGQQAGRIKFATTLFLNPSLSTHKQVKVDCLIFSKLTSYVPRKSCEFKQLQHFHHLPLADPDPTSMRAIDLLLGADVYGDILLPGMLRFPGEPLAQLTIFGWILSGSYSSSTDNTQETVVTSLHVISNSELSQSMNQFWEIEEVPTEPHLSQDERKCETLFKETTRRNPDGRYCIDLPFKSELPLDIGDSFDIAHKQYLRLERRLARDENLSQSYHSFLKEYLDLGHMIPYVPVTPSEQVCYIPHHPVVKESSSTTKVRVVFNASCHTSNGHSLNDHLLPGPKLQQDLSAILMRWRLHRYVLVADIEKMFRQILVNPEHTRYQLILWRDGANSVIKPFRLQTVTYGTTSAPYLALRVLKQLAEDERPNFPLAYEQLDENTYVDDIAFGASTCVKIREIRDQLRSVSNNGGFVLRKWKSNAPEALLGLPADICEFSGTREFRLDEGIKILGIYWCTNTDCFKYAFDATAPSSLTKRSILSFVSKLFDPLGWISPIIVVAKILMQRLWQSQLTWDTPLSNEDLQSWTSFHTDLQALHSIELPRWVDTDESCTLQLHAFCDASQSAYAAAVYLRVETTNGVRTHLIISKSKVAPLKTLTIPRLELCAAELLSRLIPWTVNNLKLQNVDIFAWSDSSVTLSWLSGNPSQWKTFVANRVARIQTRCPNMLWRYVPSAQNPADLASRGVSSAALKDNSLWWQGPSWLKSSTELWPSELPTEIGNLDREERKVKFQVLHTYVYPFHEIAQRSSDWEKLIRAAAVFIRYKAILYARIQQRAVAAWVDPSSELKLNYQAQARVFWTRVVQSHCFSAEIGLLQAGKDLPKGNKLLSIDPYVDKDGVLRVGGRLDNADLELNAKHQILLSTHYITGLIIQSAHRRTMHGGVSLTMRYLFETYWIFRAKIMVRSEIAKCVICVRNRAMLATQRMAALPDVRVRRQRAFYHTGIDYAGPISVKITSGRGNRTHKAYIAVFVCMITRAIHLELVNDYSTVTFLAAFKRFCSRRGLPAIVMSDNGTTFRGASRELYKEFRAVITDSRIAASLANDGVEWNFIPPGSPHFGGIWEAGVKSVKYHLRRIIGAHTLSAEEYTTVLCQVEACLNSRPIAGFSDDPDDLSYLTPGHFLVGAPLIVPPETSALDTKLNLLTRWRLVQHSLESFWKVWTLDYLRSLQKRYKWRSTKPNIQVGDMVLLSNENLPPTKWALGRIMQCHTNKRDNLVRVCQVKTASGSFTRPIHKMCVLPIASELRDIDSHLPTDSQ